MVPVKRMNYPICAINQSIKRTIEHTFEGFRQIDIRFRDRSHAVVNNVQPTLFRVISAQDVQNSLQRSVHVAFDDDGHLRSALFVLYNMLGGRCRFLDVLPAQAQGAAFFQRFFVGFEVLLNLLPDDHLVGVHPLLHLLLLPVANHNLSFVLSRRQTRQVGTMRHKFRSINDQNKGIKNKSENMKLKNEILSFFSITK